MTHTVSVMVQTPAHSGVGTALSYTSQRPLPEGCLVRVPLGHRETLGIVGSTPPEANDNIAPDSLKPVTAVLEGIAPLDAQWRQLVAFAAQYYQRSMGEVALSALPNALRDLSVAQWQRRLTRHAKQAASATTVAPNGAAATVASARVLSQEQAAAQSRIASEQGPILLWGSTGSGKTEV